MNLSRLIDGLNERANGLRAIDDADSAKQMVKIGRIRDKIATRFQSVKFINKTRNDRFTRQLGIAYRQVISGKRFMAFDIERLESGQFHEIGITMFQGRNIESFNYRLKGIERGPKFIFGTTIEAEFDIIKNLIQIHAEGADLYVGHSIMSDLEHLSEEGITLPDRFRYDTALWSKNLFGYIPSLYHLTRKYNVGSTQFHCGGNDARYTAEVFLKMVHTHYDEQ
jgi:hypothetical protein